MKKLILIILILILIPEIAIARPIEENPNELIKSEIDTFSQYYIRYRQKIAPFTEFLIELFSDAYREGIYLEGWTNFSEISQTYHLWYKEIELLNE